VKYCDVHGGKPLLLYLTGHYGSPLRDFEEASRELHEKLPEFAREHPIQSGWLSWRHIGKAFERPIGVAQEDLVALADRMDFRFFEGIRPIYPRPSALWQFRDVFRFEELSKRMRMARPMNNVWSFES
jgi:hypothetical protein